MMFGLLAASATLPKKLMGCWSVSGDHAPPPLVVFQTPPLAVATYHVLGSVGCVAMSSTRPEQNPNEVAPQASGAGSMKVQLTVLSGIEVERKTRRSRDSRDQRSTVVADMHFLLVGQRWQSRRVYRVTPAGDAPA